jgi:succinate dehydrogenase/fumarate reductase cytochrome b subunit
MTETPSDIALDRRRARRQAASGIALAGFVAVHLAAVAAAAWGPEGYDAVQRPTRALYTVPWAEIGLLGALGIHLVTGVQRALARRRVLIGAPRPTPPLRTRLQRASAAFLLVVIGGHVIATRAPDWLTDTVAGAAGVRFTLDALPWLFTPYYALLVLSGLYHASHGTVVALGRLGIRPPRAVTRGAGFWVPLAVISILCLAGLAGLAGFTYPIPDPYDNDFARLALELVGASPR